MISLGHFGFMSKIDKRIIGKNIKKLREATGLSQLDLSILIDISKRTLANLEAGRTSGNLDLLNKIIDFFNFSLHDLSKEEIEITVDFRDILITHHKRNVAYINLLNKKPNIVYAIKYKLLPDGFLEIPREIHEIRDHFKEFGWNYLGTSISNALKRMPERVLISKHESKRNTNVYLTKKM